MIKQTLQSDKPTISDWKRSASNVENMEVIMENSRNDYNYNRETSDPYAPKYDETRPGRPDISSIGGDQNQLI